MAGGVLFARDSSEGWFAVWSKGASAKHTDSGTHSQLIGVQYT
jgi:hypothetical protein